MSFTFLGSLLLLHSHPSLCLHVWLHRYFFVLSCLRRTDVDYKMPLSRLLLLTRIRMFAHNSTSKGRCGKTNIMEHSPPATLTSTSRNSMQKIRGCGYGEEGESAFWVNCQVIFLDGVIAFSVIGFCFQGLLSRIGLLFSMRGGWFWICPFIRGL